MVHPSFVATRPRRIILNTMGSVKEVTAEVRTQMCARKWHELLKWGTAVGLNFTVTKLEKLEVQVENPICIKTHCSWTFCLPCGEGKRLPEGKCKTNQTRPGREVNPDWFDSRIDEKWRDLENSAQLEYEVQLQVWDNSQS